MMSIICNTFLVFFVVCLIEVDALKTCNQTIINEIMSRHICPTGVLSKLSTLSPFTYSVNPKGLVPDYVKCVNGRIDAPSNGKSTALVTAYFKNTTRAPSKIKYIQQDVGCGHIKEWDENSNEFQIYVLEYKEAFCYYRCTTYETEGQDFGACAVPISQTDNAKVKYASQECKKKLRAVGITGELVDLVTCGSG